MLEKLGDFAEAATHKAGEIYSSVHGVWGRYNPDLYSASDARHSLSKVHDREYLLGTNEVNPRFNKDRSKIWSLPPDILERIREIIKDSGHVHAFPFVMGTYNMADQSMRMNDLSVSDPWIAYLMATGRLEGFIAPILRGFYYAGRPSWWRHESIHVRHHHQMAYFLDATDTRERGYWNEGWQTRSRLEEAALTIHEAGIEELLTRWQSLKESRGLREKAVSTLALLLYLEYAPFTGIRNMFIDTKEKTVDLIEDGRIRIPAKIAMAVGTALVPYYLNGQAHMVESLGEAVSDLLPVSDRQVTGAIWRGHSYVFVAALSALFSTKQKGAFERGEDDGRRMQTTEYKFPYVYNPINSVARSVAFLRYLSRVWDQIPNYRLVESPKDIDGIKREVDDRLSGRMSDEHHHFTMQTVEEALRPFEGDGRSSFPQDAYIKGMFTPAMYLKLRELYSH